MVSVIESDQVRGDVVLVADVSGAVVSRVIVSRAVVLVSTIARAIVSGAVVLGLLQGRVDVSNAMGGVCRWISGC